MRDFSQLGDGRFFVHKLLLIQVAKFRAVKSNSEVRAKHSLSVLPAKEDKRQCLATLQLKSQVILLKTLKNVQQVSFQTVIIEQGTTLSHIYVKSRKLAKKKIKK